MLWSALRCWATEMLRGKNYMTLDTIFSFLAGFIDRCTGWMKKARQTKVDVLYSEFMLNTKGDKDRKGWIERQLMKLKYRVE